MPLYPPSPWPVALPKGVVSTVTEREHCCNNCCYNSAQGAQGSIPCHWLNCNLLWHRTGLEDCTSTYEGHNLAGQPPSGACWLPQKLACWRPETQSGQPYSEGCPPVQAGVPGRSASQDLCHRYAVEPIVTGIDMRINAYRLWVVFRGVCMLCTTLLVEELLPGLKRWSEFCNLLVWLLQATL